MPGMTSSFNANDQLATDTYDNNGNTTASAGKGYSYDFENHVVQLVLVCTPQSARKCI